MANVVAIHITPTAGAPTRKMDSAQLRARRGIEGDHHCLDAAPEQARNGRDITLIETEALEAMQRDYGIALPPSESRRNVLTRGISLNHLVGKEFRLGKARLVGVRLCEPCAYLEKLTQPGVREALVHRGGLRATILEDGTVQPGDEIVPL